MNPNEPDQQQKSRFAELAVELVAVELLGAKMATEIIRDIWQQASPEVKAELGASIVAKLRDRITHMAAWDFDRVLGDAIPQAVQRLREEIDSGTGAGAALVQAAYERIVADNQRQRDGLTGQVYELVSKHVKLAVQEQWTALVREQVMSILKNARATVELAGPTKEQSP